MGEIFLDGDVWAARMLVPVSVYPPGQPHRSLMLAAMIDTGATHTAIVQPIAQLLGLAVVGSAFASGPGAALQVPRYQAALEIWRQDFGSECAVHWPSMTLTAMITPSAGVSLLIGMDILQNATTTLRPDGRWTLKFAH